MIYNYDDELIYIVYYLIRLNLVLFLLPFLKMSAKIVLASEILCNYYYKKRMH